MALGLSLYMALPLYIALRKLNVSLILIFWRSEVTVGPLQHHVLDLWMMNIQFVSVDAFTSYSDVPQSSRVLRHSKVLVIELLVGSYLDMEVS